MEGFDLSTISDVYVGSTQYSEIYYGSNKVWPTDLQYRGFCRLTLNDDSVVEIQGSGKLTSAMISNYKSTLVSAKIGELCTSINESAFNGCSGLTSITIGNSVTSIGIYAFSGCISLTSIDIPNSVISIGQRAFVSCRGLTNVIIGNSVTSIGNNAFEGCLGLTSVIIPNSVTSIGDKAFTGSGLTNVIIGNSVTSIGTGCFQHLINLSSITVNAITPPVLGNNVFVNNASNRKIYVPSDSVDAYKLASGWSAYADRIQAIPSE